LTTKKEIKAHLLDLVRQGAYRFHRGAVVDSFTKFLEQAKATKAKFSVDKLAKTIDMSDRSVLSLNGYTLMQKLDTEGVKHKRGAMLTSRASISQYNRELEDGIDTLLEVVLSEDNTCCILDCQCLLELIIDEFDYYAHYGRTGKNFLNLKFQF
jgi:hypothetical protein